ncbi:MAG: hypothetical protein JSS87_01975 [Acidobacteria bacterium]|nr:hypothetical protein [Acidobacteriota bacterium]
MGRQANEEALIRIRKQEAFAVWPWPDRLIFFLLAIYGVLVLGSLLFSHIHFLPAEDAIILHQYSRNLAEHGAITYYAGGPHTEGATDFGWMLFLAAAMRAGISPMLGTALVNALSLCFIAIALLKIARIRLNAFHVLAIAGAAGLVPQIMAALSDFAVLPEALLLTLLVAATLEQRSFLAPLLAFVLCLFRPDGVLFAIPLLIWLVWMSNQRTRRIYAIAAFFIVPGILYFVWRAHYFGELFPLPFLVKADVHRFLGILVPHSFSQSLKYLLLDAALIAPLLKQRCIRRPLVLSLLAIPTLFYWAMRLDQNVGDRFFFYIPLAAAILIATCWNSIDQRRRSILLRTGAIAFLILMFGPLRREVRTFRDYQFQNVQAIAAGLQQLPSRGTLLTSEAGYLAYGSDWITYDPWGLNTARFAKHFIQPEDVAALHPDLIALHPDIATDCTPTPQWPQSYPDRAWEHMVRNVALGAHNAGAYELWFISYGSNFYRTRKHWQYGEGDPECFFLNRNSTNYAGMRSLLQQHHGHLAK